MLKITKQIPILILPVISLAGCNGCCNNSQPDPPIPDTIPGHLQDTNPVTELTNHILVSNSNGHIRHILMQTEGTSDRYTLNYFMGCTTAFGVERIKAIYKIITLEPTRIRQLRSLSKNDSLPATFTEVLKSYMGDDNLKELRKDKEFDRFCKALDQKSGSQNLELYRQKNQLIEFEKKIALKVEEYSTEKLKQLMPDVKKLPQVIAHPDFQTAAVAGSRTGLLDFWVQDMFMPLQKFDSDTQLKLIYSKGNELQQLSVLRIKESLKYPDTTSVDIFDLEGGNILYSSNYAVAGKRILHENFEQYGPRSGMTRSNFNKKFDTYLKKTLNVKYIFWTGFDNRRKVPGIQTDYRVYQPVFHVDMYLTPSGLTINDSSLVFVAQIDKSYYPPEYLRIMNRNKVIDDLNKLIQSSKTDLKNSYDTLQNKTDIKPFCFRTIPMIVEFEDAKNTIKTYHSLNNVVIEISQHEKKIYLPKYMNNHGIDYASAMKKAGMDYKACGLDTIFVNPYVNNIGDGALHCYTKVIWREQE